MKYLYLEFSEVNWLLQFPMSISRSRRESNNTGYHGTSSYKLARNYV